LKALLLSSDRTLLAEAESHLAAWGFEVGWSNDLDAVGRRCESTPADLYLVEWRTGDTAGLELCRRVRGGEKGHLRYIWVVTARSGPDVVKAVVDAGADDCLRLPFDADDLDVRIAAAKRRILEVHDRDQIQEALRRSNERFDLAVKGANEGLWDAIVLSGVPWFSPETPVWYSPRFKQSLGFRDDEFPNVLQSWLVRLHPDDRDRIMSAVADHVERRVPYDVEYRLRAKSGEYRWFSARGLGIWNAAGEMTRMAGSLRDITEARRTADALKSSEEKWRGLVEHAPDYILVVDLEGTIRFINRVSADYKIEEVIGANALDFGPIQDRQRVIEAIESVARTGQPARLETSVAHPDGRIGWYSCRLGPIERDGVVDSVVIITTDVTDHKLMEDERQKFFALVENGGDFIGMLSPDGDLLYLNPAGRKMVGLDEDPSKQPLALAQLLTEAGQQRFSEVVLPSVLSTGRWAGEMQFRHRLSGELIDVHHKIFLVRHPESGAPLCLATITRDVSDRKRGEAALRREQEFLRRLLDLQERDRQLVAYEIHDGMVQEMTGALMHLEAFRHAPDRHIRDQEFERGSRLLREAVNEARRLISGLRPPVIDDLGVVAAVEYLINEARPDLPNIEYLHRTTFDRLVPPLESAIFRIVQEALSNVRKHSGSRRARVELIETDGTLKLSIRDWGCGFDPADVSRERFGLQGIRQRARLLGTTATIESSPGQGTLIAVDLPLIRAEQDAPAAVGLHSANGNGNANGSASEVVPAVDAEG
jgi:PAS domain S-box-containing protein